MLAGMRRLIPFAVLALAAPASAEDRRFQVEDFDRIVVEGPYSVRLVTGRASTAIGHGTRDALDQVSVDVHDMVLRVRRNPNGWSSANRAAPGPLTFEITTRALRSARLIGAGRLEVEGVRGLRAELALQGGGTLRATAVDADALAVALLGAGTVELAGRARTFSVLAQGTGGLSAPGLVANSATLTASTSGALALTVNGPVTVANNGLGTVRIYGRAVCTTSGVSAEQVQCGGVPPGPASNQGQSR